jgi:two-component system, response regulator PdtaR
MTEMLRIAVADDEPRMREYYQETLSVLGHRVECAARTGRELVEHCRASLPDLIITDIRMPDMDGIDAIAEITSDRRIPVILVSAYHDAELFARIKDRFVMTYLVKPIKQADLETAIIIALQRFEQFQSIAREMDELRQNLENRKLIERAKGILMKKAALDEEAAFLRLQKLARDQNQKLVEVARTLIQVEQVFQQGSA